MIDQVPGNGADHGGRPGEFAPPSDEPRHSATEGHDRAPHDGIRFHELAELTEEGLIQVDDRARVSFVNTRLARMLHTSIDVLIGRPVTDFVVEEERAAVLADFEELLSGRADVVRAVRRVHWADQPEIWAQVAARATRNAHGGLDTITAVLTDITERVEQQQALEQTSRQLEEAQRLARLGHWRLELPSGHLTWSPVIFELLGFDPQQVEPDFEELLTIVHPEDRQAVLATNQRAVEHGSAAVTHRFVRRDGEELVVRAMVAVEYDDRGRPRRLVGTIQDVTATARAQQALQASERQLQRLLAATNDGWWDIDPIAGTAYYSDRWWQIHGYEPGELPATTELWRQLADPDDLPRYDAELAAILRRRETQYTIEGHVLHKQGHRVSIVVRGVVDYDAQGRPVRFSGVNTDVTDARAAEVAKDEFISTVSHELRTPLTSIGGALELIDAGRGGAVPDGISQLLAVARRNTDRLRVLINDLLDVERLHRSGASFASREHRLAELIDRAVADHGPSAETRRVRLTTHLDDSEVTVLADAGRIEQVLGNYLSNALKFAPAASTVQVALQASAELARVEVVDHGPGVPAEIAERVFDRFVQADPADHRSRGGTGLGLAISRAIIEQHGGQVGLVSRPGHCCFWFELPRVDPVREPPPADPADPAAR